MWWRLSLDLNGQPESQNESWCLAALAVRFLGLQHVIEI